MRKKRNPQKHSVKATMNVLELSKRGSAVEFEIYSENEKIGTLKIGRGSIGWIGRSKQKAKTISWTRFAELME